MKAVAVLVGSLGVVLQANGQGFGNLPLPFSNVIPRPRTFSNIVPNPIAFVPPVGLNPFRGASGPSQVLPAFVRVGEAAMKANVSPETAAASFLSLISPEMSVADLDRFLSGPVPEAARRYREEVKAPLDEGLTFHLFERETRIKALEQLSSFLQNAAQAAAMPVPPPAGPRRNLKGRKLQGLPGLFFVPDPRKFMETAFGAMVTNGLANNLRPDQAARDFLGSTSSLPVGTIESFLRSGESSAMTPPRPFQPVVPGVGEASHPSDTLGGSSVKDTEAAPEGVKYPEGLPSASYLEDMQRAVISHLNFLKDLQNNGVSHKETQGVAPPRKLFLHMLHDYVDGALNDHDDGYGDENGEVVEDTFATVLDTLETGNGPVTNLAQAPSTFMDIFEEYNPIHNDNLGKPPFGLVADAINNQGPLVEQFEPFSSLGYQYIRPFTDSFRKPLNWFLGFDVNEIGSDEHRKGYSSDWEWYGEI